MIRRDRAKPAIGRLASLVAGEMENTMTEITRETLRAFVDDALHRIGDGAGRTRSAPPSRYGSNCST